MNVIFNCEDFRSIIIRQSMEILWNSIKKLKILVHKIREFWMKIIKKNKIEFICNKLSKIF